MLVTPVVNLYLSPIFQEESLYVHWRSTSRIFSHSQPLHLHLVCSEGEITGLFNE